MSAGIEQAWIGLNSWEQFMKLEGKVSVKKQGYFPGLTTLPFDP